MNTQNPCPGCGAPIPDDSPERDLCPRCLMNQALGGDRPTGTVPGGENFEAPAPEELSAHFPDLEIQELIGQGGMGCVYRARQVRLDRLVALKILSPRLATGEQFAERFTREARTLARVGHPSIVAIHDYGEAGGFHYLVMEHVDGANLRDVMHDGRLTPREALAIVSQVCEAIQYAHDEGIVHRDIKPENILIDRKGRVRIADFGLAKLLLPGREPDRLTGTGRMLGTPVYMAPEQIEHPGSVDHRADIYSLGVVFYEMLTGELPLGHFAPPSHKVSVDVRLDEVVLRTLAKEPERRYQHASDVKKDVDSIPDAEASAPPRGESAKPAASASPDARKPPSPTSPDAQVFAWSRPSGIIWSAVYFFLCMGLGGPVLVVAGAPALVTLAGLVQTIARVPHAPYMMPKAGVLVAVITFAPILAGLLLLAIAVGIGLLLLQGWARKTGIVLTTLGLVYSAAVLLGMVARFWLDTTGFSFASQRLSLLGVFGALGIVPIIGWIILTVMARHYLRRPDVAQMFASEK